MRTDDEIRDDILAEIDWDPQIESNDIGVTVEDGAVTLYGTVQSYAARLAAERAAKRVKGVRAVAEEIKVKYPSDWTVSDQDIAEAISSILQWNAALCDYDIKAEVRSGYVTLTGKVDWRFQRETARELIAEVRGVTGVSNQIALLQRTSAVDVKKKITQALHRNADFEASHITVNVDGSKVTLNGNVKAWYERKLVEDAVWAAPGVTSIQDNLHVA